MRKVINLIAATSLILGVSIATFANTPRVNRRQHNQQERIAQGLESGSLTAREAARLEARETKIHQDEHRAKADGYVSTRERAKLNRELKNSNDKIYQQKHDRQWR